MTTLGQGAARDSAFLLQSAWALSCGEPSVWGARAAGAGWHLFLPLGSPLSPCGFFVWLSYTSLFDDNLWIICHVVWQPRAPASVLRDRNGSSRSLKAKPGNCHFHNILLIRTEQSAQNRGEEI